MTELDARIEKIVKDFTIAYLCKDCDGGGWNYEKSKRCQGCEGLGINNWDFEGVTPRIKSLVHEQVTAFAEEVKKGLYDNAERIDWYWGEGITNKVIDEVLARYTGEGAE